jgi:putative ABC transport system ATP-binding protein
VASFFVTLATATSRNPVLQLDHVGKRYGDRWVLSGVTLSICAGESVALVGPSGSGKTTLLNLAGGVDRADSGEVTVAGTGLRSLDSDGLARLRRESVGTIFQFFHLLPTLSASENIELPLRLLGVGDRESRGRAADALARVGLSGRAAALPSELSGGEQQRVAIARALVHRPRLVLADEPTGSLDTANGRRVMDLLLQRVGEEGAALVMVTHSEEAAATCARRVHMRDGTIVEAR